MSFPKFVSIGASSLTSPGCIVSVSYTNFEHNIVLKLNLDNQISAVHVLFSFLMCAYLNDNLLL